MVELTALSFEEAFARLQETTARLEAGELPLDEALVLYEEGVSLANYCTDLLDRAELRVSVLGDRPSDPRAPEPGRDQ